MILGVKLTVLKDTHMAGKVLLILYASVGTDAVAVLNGIPSSFA